MWNFWFGLFGLCFFSNSVTARKFHLSLDVPHIKRTKEKLRTEIVALLHFFTVICFYISYDFEKLCTYFSLIFKVIFVSSLRIAPWAEVTPAAQWGPARWPRGWVTGWQCLGRAGAVPSWCQGLCPSRALSVGTVGSRSKNLLSCSFQVAMCPSASQQLPVISLKSLGEVGFAEV